MKPAPACLCALLLTVSSACVQGAESAPVDYHARDTDRLGWAAPDFAKIQTGGYSGLFTVGLGYAVFSDVLNLGLDYGYVPESHAGRTVHSLTASLGIRPFDVRLGRFRLLPAYLWAGVLHTWGDGYFFTPGERYPPGYYRPTAVHVLYGIGAELDWMPPASSWFERHGVYWEVRAFGPYFVTYLENRDELGLDDVVVSAVGYRAAF